MISKRCLVLVGVLVIFFSGVAWPQDKQEQEATEVADYIIGPGDVLAISAWKDETLTREVVVLPDGKISFPLIGEVAAGGKTVAGLKKDVESKLAPFVPDITLSLMVKQVASVIYVIGRVNAPGRFPVNVNVNVLQALAIAGGCSEFARKDKIKIFRDEGGKTTIYNFHYDSVIQGKQLEENIMLKRGDIVVVP